MSQSSVSCATRLLLAASAEEEILEVTALSTTLATGTAAMKHTDVIASASRPNASLALLTARKSRELLRAERRHLPAYLAATVVWRLRNLSCL
jgi:hypothetical protein